MKKNILFLMADQFAYHALGCLGSCAQTPALDYIAQQAQQFTRCYSNCPLCMPSRASLATGLYPVEIGAMDNYSEGLMKESVTWMQRIRDDGYHTSVFGKVHLHRFAEDLRDLEEQTRSYGYDVVHEIPGPRTYGMKRSYYYDYLEERGLLECYQEDITRRYETGPVYDSSPGPLATEDYADVYVARQALEYLNRIPREQPWFCTVSFGGPHDPWDTPAEFTALYDSVTPPQPLPPPKSMNPNRPKGVYDEILNGRYDPSLTEDIRKMTREDVIALRKSYYGHVTLIDRQIGKLLECLDRRGMLDQTIVVFTADHGEENGDYGLLFKQTFFESSVRVPMMIWNPGWRGKTIDRCVELMDLGPTLCELIGLNGEIGHAKSMVPLMQGNPYAKKREVSQIFGETMVLEDSIKAVFNQMNQIYLLFDLEHDPEERYNLAGTPEAEGLEKSMRQSLEEWRRELILDEAEKRECS